jgi:mono/diheme cytochrome c family protein
MLLSPRPTPPPMPGPAARARPIADLYARNCAACHGPEGRGDGPAADALDPRPRDFVAQPLRYAATGGTRPQIARAVAETIRRGLPHSAMPGFAAVLDEKETNDLAGHVLSLAANSTRPAPPGQELRVPEPPEFTQGLVSRGKDVYFANICASCHGDDGRPDAAINQGLADFDGRPIRAADLASGAFKAGRRPEDLYRAIIAGVPGTPMAAYRPMVVRRRADGTTDDRDAWALVALIRSWGTPGAPSDGLIRPVVLEAPAELDDPDNAAWFDIRPVRVPLFRAQHAPHTPLSVEVRAIDAGDRLTLRLAVDGVAIVRARVVACRNDAAPAPTFAAGIEPPPELRAWTSNEPRSAHAVVLGMTIPDRSAGMVLCIVIDDDAGAGLFTGWTALLRP